MSSLCNTMLPFNTPVFKGEFLVNSVVTQPNTLDSDLGIENGCVTLDASLNLHANTTSLSIVKVICYDLKSCIGGLFFLTQVRIHQCPSYWTNFRVYVVEVSIWILNQNTFPIQLLAKGKKKGRFFTVCKEVPVEMKPKHFRFFIFYKYLVFILQHL